jgi:hypothetical protein
MIRFPFDFESPSCYVDPITLTGLALGALAGGGAALASGGGSSAPTPQAPPAMAAPQQNPIGTKPQTQSNQPSFIGASAIPSNQSGQKTLLGQ